MQRSYGSLSMHMTVFYSIAAFSFPYDGSIDEHCYSVISEQASDRWKSTFLGFSFRHTFTARIFGPEQTLHSVCRLTNSEILSLSTQQFNRRQRIVSVKSEQFQAGSIKCCLFAITNLEIRSKLYGLSQTIFLIIFVIFARLHRQTSKTRIEMQNFCLVTSNVFTIVMYM